MSKNKTLLTILSYLFLSIYISSIFFIFYQARKTGINSSMQSSMVANFLYDNFYIAKKIASVSTNYEYLVRKVIGHYGLFAFCGFFGTLAFLMLLKNKFNAILICTLNCVIVAVISELIQKYTSNRYCSFTDILVDFQGYISGTIVVLIFSSLFIKNSYKINLKIFCAIISFVFLSSVLFIIFSTKIESIYVCFYLELFFTLIFIILNLSTFLYMIFKN